MNNQDIVNKVFTAFEKALKVSVEGPAKSANTTMALMYLDYIRMHILPFNEKTQNFFKLINRDPLAPLPEGFYEYLELALKSETKASLALEQANRIESFFNASMIYVPKMDINNQNIENIVKEYFNFDLSGGTVVVPWDFSKMSEAALQFAIIYAKFICNKIILLHICENKANLSKCKVRLDEKVKQLKEKNYSVEIEGVVSLGKLSDAIISQAEKLRAILIVMGTHGAQGMQKILGTKALSVILGSKIPFLVVQRDPINNLEKIAFPVGPNKTCRQKVRIAEIISEKIPYVSYDILRPSKVGQFDSMVIQDNVEYICDFFNQRSIPYQVKALDGSNIAKLTLDYIKNNRVDMVLTTVSKNLNVVDYFTGLDEENLVFNDNHVPVLCINPVK